MHARGLIDAHEHATLQAAELPPARWYLMVIEWVMAGLSYGKRQGLLTGDGGFEAVTLGKVCELRSACMTLPDELAARIPLAYVHFTAFLVDALLFLSPLALVRLAAACPTPLRPLGKKEEEEIPPVCSQIPPVCSQIPPVCSQIPPVRSLPFRRTARPSTCAQPSAHVSFALAALSLFDGTAPSPGRLHHRAWASHRPILPRPFGALQVVPRPIWQPARLHHRCGLVLLCTAHPPVNQLSAVTCTLVPACTCTPARTADLSAEISIDTLIGESNAGSLVWPKGAQYMPFLAEHGPIGVTQAATPVV